MPVTRSSARLAKVQAAKLTPLEENLDLAPKSDKGSVESEYNESDEEQARPPERKRQRVVKKANKSAAKKRQVRGKTGRLAGVMRMPIEIFTEIAAHLLPGDIISLARSNKFFHRLIMTKSSLLLWHGAMKNVNGLPPCPPDLSLPRYLSMLFSKNCTSCGAIALRRMDEFLRVRLCTKCRHENVMLYFRAPAETLPLLHRSFFIVPNRRRHGCESHVLRREVEEVSSKLLELQQTGDGVALEEWRMKRKKEVEDRAEQARQLTRFLDEMDAERERELSVLKQERREEVERRLMQIGWEAEDLNFNYFSPVRREWHSLVDQTRPITDRIWENLRDRLIPLVQANRDERLKREKDSRQASRRERLIALMNAIKMEAGPLVRCSVPPPVLPASTVSSKSTSSINNSSSTLSSSASPGEGNVVAYWGISPEFVDALEWPVVKDLYDADTSAAVFEAGFEAHRAEIITLVAEWKVRVQAALVNVVSGGQPTEQALEPMTVVDGSGPDPLADLPDDLKYLLRADSFFQHTRLQTGPPLICDAVVPLAYSYTTEPNVMRPIKLPLDISRIRRYEEAQDAARMLLEGLGRPNACYLEMRCVGQKYYCGRCHDGVAKTWEEMVYHYVTEKRRWEKLQLEPSSLAKAGVIYRNVHDPSKFTEKPMIKYGPTQTEEGGIQGCKICLKWPVRHDVRCTEGKMVIHLRDVHGITRPRVHEHYDNALIMGVLPVLDFDLFPDDWYSGMFLDEEDWDGDSDEGLMWDW